MNHYLKIHENDNVIVALENLSEGDKLIIGHQTIEIKSFVPFGHKMAIASIDKGEEIYKYGLSIGHAASHIEIGQHVHTHNLKSNRS